MQSISSFRFISSKCDIIPQQIPNGYKYIVYGSLTEIPQEVLRNLIRNMLSNINFKHCYHLSKAPVSKRTTFIPQSHAGACRVNELVEFQAIHQSVLRLLVIQVTYTLRFLYSLSNVWKVCYLWASLLWLHAYKCIPWGTLWRLGRLSVRLIDPPWKLVSFCFLPCVLG